MDLPTELNGRPLPADVDDSYLERALTHSSYANEVGLDGDNERLEYLGDAAVDLIVADHLFQEFPDLPEGKLSKIKSGVVSTDSLRRIARRLNLDEYLRISRGQQKADRGKQKLLADCLEAFVGAIYLSTDLPTTRQFILPELQEELQRYQQGHRHNPKGILVEIAQDQGWSDPVYRVLEVRGPEHDPYHVMSVEVNGEQLGTGEGRKKKTAEQDAAGEALRQLQEEPPDWVDPESISEWL